MLRFTKYWLPVLLFMALIYSVSGDHKSMHHSSRLIEPVIRWLLPGLSDTGVRAGVFYVRKLAHFGEYFVLYLLLWRALRHTWDHSASDHPRAVRSRPVQTWNWPQSILTLGLVSLYAVSDELHQTFVPNRQGSAIDVLIDTAGAATALLLLWAAGRYLKKW